MEITKGKWQHINHISSDFTHQVNKVMSDTVSICIIRTNNKEQAENNAKLIADAGNTYQSTSKLPSELAEANKELLEVLKKALTVLVKAEYTDGYDATIEAELVDTLHKHTNHA